MPARDAEEEFEFLVNLLASDGAEPDPPVGCQEGGAGSGVRIGSDGKLDLGQVKAFYERKNAGHGKEKEKEKGFAEGPGLANYSRNRSGLWDRIPLFCICTLLRLRAL